MPIDPILSKPTLPEVEQNKGPLLFDEFKGDNDVDTAEADDAGVCQCDE